MTAADSFVQAVQALPLRLRQETLSLPEGDRGRAEELRLRAGWPMTAVLPEGERLWQHRLSGLSTMLGMLLGMALIFAHIH